MIAILFVITDIAPPPPLSRYRLGAMVQSPDDCFLRDDHPDPRHGSWIQ